MKTAESRGQILWVDDEITHLKPHILFLEDKGYSVTTTTNGSDAISMVSNSAFDMILLDHFMPGMDGIETLKKLNSIIPNTPIVMITKSEEEWLMDEAIAGKIAHFLIKPVNPTQIFMAIKQILEKQEIQSKNITSNFLNSFQEFERRVENAHNIDDWWNLYSTLVNWQLEFDLSSENTLGTLLDEQFQNCNKEFSHFVESNYVDWIHSKERPLLSPDIISRSLAPEVEINDKVCFVVIDSLRYDHFLTIKPDLEKIFKIETQPHIAILPTATPFSRNSIFSGLFPADIIDKYPQQKQSMLNHDPSLNQFEMKFIEDQMKRLKFQSRSVKYHKIWTAEEGLKIENRISDYLGINVLSFVVNFVDILAHRRSESTVLMELVPDEAGFRKAVKSWFEDSWLYRILIQLSNHGYTVFLTSDHGSLRVKKSVVVKADKESSSGIRYKYGRNLNCNNKRVLNVRKPEEYRLPSLEHQFNYLIAKNDAFLLYPNQYNKFDAKLKGSFQHGGISLEEMLVPLAKMTPIGNL